MISGETLAIVAATGLGPILAVVVTFWREERNSLRMRRLWVFRTLMATRRVGISPDHVNALNLVEVDFYGCAGVQEKWKIYKDHLFSTGPEDEVWNEKKERLLANLLFEMASALKFKIPAMEIFKGGYAPKEWQHRDIRQFAAMEYKLRTFQGNKGCSDLGSRRDAAAARPAHVVTHSTADANDGATPPRPLTASSRRRNLADAQ